MRHSIERAAQLDLLLREGDRLAGGDPDLLAHDVDAGRHLGDRVLDLHAGVHLEEEVLGLAVLVAGQQALDRAGRAVADRLGGVGRDLADPLAGTPSSTPGRRASPRSASGGGAAPSSRARPGARRCRARRPAPGPRRGAGPRGSAPGRRSGRRRTSRPRGCALERLLQLVLGHRDAEALPAAAAGRLDRDRVADLLGDRLAPPSAPRPARWCRARSARRRPSSARAPWSSSPSPRSPSAGGPMNTSPAFSQALAKGAFSARKP